MKVLVTGATGFTGSYVVPNLLGKQIAVKCLLRATSASALLTSSGVELARGDLSDEDSMTRALDGCDALVNIASLGFGHTPNVVMAARRARVKRAVFISTTAIFTELNASSKATRLAAEQRIIDSGLPFTILRPTMIYGSSNDRNICRLIRYLCRWPLIPVLGSGKFLQQPVYVGDVADAVVRALISPHTIQRSYNISGSAPLSFNEVVATICRYLGRKVFMLHFPAGPAVAALKAAERFTRRLPIKAEQVQRLNEHKSFPWDEARRDFSFSPKTFAEGVALELNQMGFARYV